MSEQLAARLGLGIATGVLLGLFTSISPVFAIVVIGAVFVIAFALIARGAPRTKIVPTAGIMIGAGLLLLYGSIVTITSCQETADFCGNTVIWPIPALAIGTLVVGGSITIFALWGGRRGL